MGGHAQAQLHLQMLEGIAIRQLDPATVTDRPRWFARMDESGAEEVVVERTSPIAAGLQQLGHVVRTVGAYDELLGHEQIVVRDPTRLALVGAADPRTDGLALGW
jgi:gamma-glutamyltranspeptidase